MPTLAEKLKGISSLPGAAVKSVRKGGRRLKASPDWGVEVARRLLLVPPCAFAWFWAVQMSGHVLQFGWTTAAVLLLLLIFWNTWLGVLQQNNSEWGGGGGSDCSFDMFCNQSLAKSACISLVFSQRFLISNTTQHNPFKTGQKTQWIGILMTYSAAFPYNLGGMKPECEQVKTPIFAIVRNRTGCKCKILSAKNNDCNAIILCLLKSSLQK